MLWWQRPGVSIVYGAEKDSVSIRGGVHLHWVLGALGSEETVVMCRLSACCIEAHLTLSYHPTPSITKHSQTKNQTDRQTDGGTEGHGGEFRTKEMMQSMEME